MDSVSDHLSDALEMVLGQAAIDDEFARTLRISPRAATAGFDLTEIELTILSSVRAQTKEELATRLLEIWRSLEVAGAADLSGGNLHRCIPASHPLQDEGLVG